MKVNIVVVGLGFGESFVEIYKQHPLVNTVGICDINEELVTNLAQKHNIDRIYTSLDAVLDDQAVDAVHLITPLPLHEEQTVRVLEAGKHCACTVPMALTLDGIRNIVKATHKSKKNFMMMETSLYTYQFMYVKQMIESGELGKIQFLRGSHYQDLAGWPSYWRGLPPMYYGTHAIAPMVLLSGSRIKRVNCLGSGTMATELEEQYGNPYPLECALLEFENGLKGEATRSLYETARMYQEGFFVYGSKKSFEWGFCDAHDPYITTLLPPPEGRRGGAAMYEVKEMPNFYQYLPEELWRFTVGKNYNPLNSYESLQKGRGGAHHGSHPHLVHEFISSIAEKRKPSINEDIGANITAAGICAHESAMKNGEAIMVPTF